MNKKGTNGGITLIALVITIIVLLILAAVSIATLTGENGILSQADKAGTETKVKSEEEQLGLSYNAVMTVNRGTGVTESQLQTELQKYDSGAKVTKKGENFEVEFSNGNIYIVKKDGTIEGPKSSNGSGVETASTLKNRLRQTEEQESVIGKEVTGLNLSRDNLFGDENLGDELYEWLIFDVDDTNIYLISKDYISIFDMPATQGGYDVEMVDDYTAKFSIVINDYEGSEDIKNLKIQKLNKNFFDNGYSSTDKNMRAVAYMLDTKIWTQKFIGNENGNNQVEYVIGAPTIEQMINSCNKKYGKNGNAKVFTKESGEKSTGYKLSVEGSTDDDYKKDLYHFFEQADGSLDSTYVKNDSKLLALASPSTESDSAIYLGTGQLRGLLGRSMNLSRTYFSSCYLSRF